jgi:hypothetical protein
MRVKLPAVLEYYWSNQVSTSNNVANKRLPSFSSVVLVVCPTSSYIQVIVVLSPVTLTGRITSSTKAMCPWQQPRQVDGYRQVVDATTAPKLSFSLLRNPFFLRLRSLSQ